MSRLTIDAHTYLRFYNHLVENYCGLGFPPAEAQAKAQADMRECYLIEEVVDLRDCQLDYDEERANDWTR